MLVARGGRADVLMAAALGDLPLLERLVQANPESLRTSVSSEWFPMRNPHAGGTIYRWVLGPGATAGTVAQAFGRPQVLAWIAEHTTPPARLVLALEIGDDTAAAALLASHPGLIGELPLEDRRRLADAAERGDSRTVQRMLVAGWPVDAPGNDGATALHFAAWQGDAGLVRALIERGAPLEARERLYRGTPLDWALHGSVHGARDVRPDHVRTVEALLAAGAVRPALAADATVSPAVRELLGRHPG